LERILGLDLDRRFSFGEKRRFKLGKKTKFLVFSLDFEEGREGY